jgi:hypothetical protein
MKFLHLNSNWGLKPLALVLAIVIYYAMRDAIRDAPDFMKGDPAHAGSAR